MPIAPPAGRVQTIVLIRLKSFLRRRQNRPGQRMYKGYADKIAAPGWRRRFRPMMFRFNRLRVQSRGLPIHKQKAAAFPDASEAAATRFGDYFEFIVGKAREDLEAVSRRCANGRRRSRSAPRTVRPKNSIRRYGVGTSV